MGFTQIHFWNIFNKVIEFATGYKDINQINKKGLLFYKVF